MYRRRIATMLPVQVLEVRRGTQTPTLMDDRVTAYTYDAAGRQIAIIEAPGTDAEATTTMIYDEAGRLETQTQPDGLVTLYHYDDAGQLLSLTRTGTEGFSQVTEYIYDELGRRVQTTYPDDTISTQT